jgi:hypothetical protein
MAPYRSFFIIARIYGMVITALMLLIFGGKIIGEFVEKGIGEFRFLARDAFHWYDNPTGFFFTYVAGYILVWWRPLWGALFIIGGSILVTVVNIDNRGFLIFALPTIMVGIFYLLTWYYQRKN